LEISRDEVLSEGNVKILGKQAENVEAKEKVLLL
jgi:hypothetical protein